MKNFSSIEEKKLFAFCCDALIKSGMDENNSRMVASHLVQTDKWGVHTHGTKNLFYYIKKNIAGGVSFKNEIEIVKEYPSSAIIDANNCLGFVSCTIAMNKACEMAEKTGIGIVFVKNSCHFGAAACYSNIAAKRGLIGIALSNVEKRMTIPGAKGIVIGHNPFSYAVPSTILPSVFLDVATSNVASLKVMKERDASHKIPFDWISDKDGLPTDDPSKYPEEGALLPMAGHKGYGIALLIEFLTSIATASDTSISGLIPSWILDMEKPNNVCHTCIAIDISKFNPSFVHDVDKAIEELHSSPKSKDSKGIFVPGEIEWKKSFASEKGGINLPEDVYSILKEMSLFLGIPLEEKE